MSEKCVSWDPSLLRGIVFQQNSNLSLCVRVSELGTISDQGQPAVHLPLQFRGNMYNLQFLILSPLSQLLEYLSGFLQL